MSENKITIITDVNKKQSGEAAKKTNTVQSEPKRSRNNDAEYKMKKAYEEAMTKQLLERKCNLYINYMVIKRVMYCMDMEDSIYSDNELLKLILHSDKNDKEHNHGEFEIIRKILNIYDQDSVDYFKKHADKNEYKIIVGQLDSLHIEINELLCVLGRSELFVHTTYNPDYKYDSEMEYEDQLSNWGRLYPIFDQMYETFGLPYEVLTGKRRINLGIQPIKNLGIQITAEKNEKVINDAVRYILYGTRLDVLDGFRTLIGETSKGFQMLRALNNQDVFAHSDNEKEILFKNSLQNGIGSFTPKRATLVHYPTKKTATNNETKPDQNNDDDINKEPRYKISDADLISELSVLRYNPLGISSFGAILTLLLESYTSVSTISTNVTEAPELSTKVQKLWEDTFYQLEYNDSTEQLTFRPNLYSLDNLIYSIAQTLMGGVTRTPYGKTYNTKLDTDRIREARFDGFEYYRIEKDFNYNTNSHSYKDISKHKQYDGTEPLYIVKPFVLEERIETDEDGKENKIINSELLDLINAMFDMRLGYFFQCERKFITTIDDEYSELVNRIKYRYDIVETFRNEFLNVKLNSNRTYKNHKLDAYLTSKRTPQEISDVDLYRTIFCERLMTKFIKMVDEAKPYFDYLRDKQNNYSEMICSINTECDQESRQAWFNSFKTEYEAMIAECKNELIQLYKIKHDEICEVLKHTGLYEKYEQELKVSGFNQESSSPDDCDDNDYEKQQYRYHFILHFVLAQIINCEDKVTRNKWRKDPNASEEVNRSKYIITDKQSISMADSSDIRRIEDRIELLQEVIEKNSMMLKTKHPLTSPYIIARNTFDERIRLFEEVRSVKTLINPSSSASCAKANNRWLFDSMVHNLKEFIDTALKTCYSSEDSRDYDDVLDLEDRLYALDDIVNDAIEKDNIRLNKNNSEDTAIEDNKHNGPLNTIKDAYKQAPDIEKDFIKICKKYGIEVPKKPLADIPKKEDMSIGINLIPPGYGKDGKPVTDTFSNKEQVINTIPRFLQIDKNDIEVWVRPENPFPYGEDRVVLLDNYEKACLIADTMIQDYKAGIKESKKRKNIASRKTQSTKE